MAVSEMAASAALAFFPVVMVLAALMDFMTMKIRNSLVLVLVLGYFVLAPLAGFGLYDVALSLAVAAGVFVVGFGLFSMGWMGGGDVKLASAAVLWLGAAHALPFVVYTALIGGALVLAVLAFRFQELPAGWHSVEWLNRLHSPQTGVPYGGAMAPAAVIVFPYTPWMAAIL